MATTATRAGSHLRSRTGPSIPSPRDSRCRWVGCAAIISVVVFPVTEMIRVLAGSAGVTLYGDQALIAIASRRAADFVQLLGPYSRTGFHHPGPTVFYLLAPFVELASSVGSGLYLGALAINLVALVATVAIVWRRVGPLAALWTAAALDLFALCLGLGTLREPWNPYLVITPMLLFVVVWAASCTGPSSYGLWALVVGSYEIQTHIATTPVVLVLLAVMVVRMRLRRLRLSGGGVWAGAAVLVAMWVPTVVELFRNRPNNLQEIWDFFTSSHQATGWGELGRVAASVLTVVPFGNHDYTLSLHRTEPELVLGFLLIAALIVFSVRVVRRHHSSFAARLVEVGLVAGGLGVLSLAGSDGPVLVYFALWLASVPVMFLIASGVALFTPGSLADVPTRAVIAPVLTGAIIVSGLATGVGFALPPVDHTIGSGPWPAQDAGSAQGRHRTVQDTAELDRASLAALVLGERSVRFVIGSESDWPYAAGVVLYLEEHGVDVTVSPTSWEFYFGPNQAPANKPAGEFGLYPAGSPAGAAPGGRVIAKVDGTELTLRQLNR
jgi:hypothetical protein